MKFDKKEKHFWRSKFNIGSLGAIPLERKGFTAIDSEEDDQFMFYLTTRIPTIHEIYLKCTNVTDEGVTYISNIMQLKELTLREHEQITKECLPYLNKLTDLEYLDVLKTKITLDDLYVLTHLQNLKELHVSSNELDESISGKVKEFNKILPKCIVYVNYEKYQ